MHGRKFLKDEIYLQFELVIGQIHSRKHTKRQAEM